MRAFPLVGSLDWMVIGACFLTWKFDSETTKGSSKGMCAAAFNFTFGLMSAIHLRDQKMRELDQNDAFRDFSFRGNRVSLGFFKRLVIIKLSWICRLIAGKFEEEPLK